MTFEGLFPDAVSWASARGDAESDVALAALSPAERASVAAAVPARMREFALGRLCARRALAGLGASGASRASGASAVRAVLVPDGEPEVLVGPRREPLWPPAIVGAITHDGSFAAAAVAHARDAAGLGLDLARCAPLPAGVDEIVCTPDERRWIAARAAASAVPWETIVFSAKESVYKAISAHVGRFVDFHEATLGLDDGQLVVIGDVAGIDGTRLAIRHAVTDAWIKTTAVLARR